VVLGVGLVRAEPGGDAAGSGEPSGEVVGDEESFEGIGAPPFGAPPSAQEARIRADALSDRLRCPVCQGLSVAASPSDAARAMAGRIHELVARGYTDEQVVDYFVDRYGAWVLLEPPMERSTLLLWGGPLLLGLFGLVWLGWWVTDQSRGVDRAGLDVERPTEEAQDPYARRILAELEDSGS
jgi:cytochrome c-type biogenesis protein CcmH